MSVAKIAISIDESILREIDRLVSNNTFPNRSRAIQDAVKDKIERISKIRLARECSKLDAVEESSLAEEGIQTEAEEWPEY
jgi:metal-responsive CopG/Arc/MetJ family transcriptional regulator